MNEQIKSLEEALQLSPDNHILRLMLAQAYQESSYPKEALKHYGILLEKGEQHDKALVPAGLIAFETGDITLARQYLSIAQKLNIDAKSLEDKLDSLKVKVPVNSDESSPTNTFADDLEIEPSIDFSNVGGLEDVKKLIERLIIMPFKRSELYAKYGKKAGGGVLMYGPPGCGKTMLARATAGECKLPFLNIKIVNILSKWIGESENNLHEAFKLAREKAPCVVFIDELDALAFSRQKQSTNYMRGLVDQLLQELDSIVSDNNDLLIIAATNAPWDIDDAMLRPGRFDRRIFVPPPDETARRAILRLHFANRFADSLDEKRLAKETPMFSGADLEALVEQGVEMVIDEAIMSGTEPPLTMKHLEEARAQLQPSTLDWLRRAKNYVEFANQDQKYNDVAKYLKSKEPKKYKI